MTTVLEPFDTTGVERGPDGIARYTELADNLVDLLRRAVDAVPDGEALVELTPAGDRVAVMTYRQLWDAATRVAGGLRAAGIARGDRVANRLPNGNAWAVAFWGIQLAGAVIVPVNTRFTEPEVAYVVEDSGAALVLQPEAPLPDGEPLVVDDQQRSDVAGIFYTSGTTGFPKGAMTTQENFLSNVETCLRVGAFDRSELGTARTLVSVPLFHVTGCNSQLLVLTGIAGTTVIMQAFDVKGMLRAISGEKVNAVTSVPAVYFYALAQPDFDSLERDSVESVMYGGAPMPPELVGRLMKAFPTARLGNGFGLTETSSVSTFLPHEYCAEHPNSVGFAAPVCDLRLIETDPDTGVGELLIRGPNVVAGYWNKPEATEAAFTDGWLHTGDLAHIDPQGLVYIVDRKKDMINRGGENVYCVEVENALASAPNVLEVSVVGVPDSMMGEKVGAVVVPVPGTTVDVDALIAHARGELADFKVPQYVAVRTDPLPRNPGGKVLKAVLREIDWGAPIRR